MRILHIITRMILGGAQENTMFSLQGQNKCEGYEVALLTGPTTGPEGNIVPLVKQQGITVIEEPHLLRAVSPYHDFKAYHALRKHIREFRPDIVHTHSSKAGILGRLAASREKVKCIIHTIHGLPFHPYQSALKNAVFIMAERIVARRTNRIVTVANAMTDKALAAGIGRKEQYLTIYSGMETAKFLKRDWNYQKLRARFGLKNGDFVIGKIARLFELKGHKYLFTAFAKLARIYPEIKLLLIGDGIWQDKFKIEIANLGLDKRVIFTGLLPREEIPEAIAVMDAVVHCSLREGLARVIPQALLSGKPVISFDIDGAGEIIKSGETGFLVRAKDTEGLAFAIEKTLNNPQAAKTMAERGCQFWQNHFSWQVMSEQLCTLYEKETSGIK